MPAASWATGGVDGPAGAHTNEDVGMPPDRAASSREPRSPELHRDRLELGVVLEGGLAVLAALARHLEAAEWRVRIDHVVAVDPDRARLDLLGEQVGLVDVLSP